MFLLFCVFTVFFNKNTKLYNFQVLFAALLAFASAKPKPLVLEYPVAAAYTAPVAAAYTAPVAYSAYSAYDYALPYSAYSYAAPYTYYVRW